MIINKANNLNKKKGEYDIFKYIIEIKNDSKTYSCSIA